MIAKVFVFSVAREGYECSLSFAVAKERDSIFRYPVACYKEKILHFVLLCRVEFLLTRELVIGHFAPAPQLDFVVFVVCEEKVLIALDNIFDRLCHLREFLFKLY